jgi:hypothetical protein
MRTSRKHLVLLVGCLLLLPTAAIASDVDGATQELSNVAHEVGAIATGIGKRRDQALRPIGKLINRRLKDLGWGLRSLKKVERQDQGLALTRNKAGTELVKTHHKGFFLVDRANGEALQLVGSRSQLKDAIATGSHVTLSYQTLSRGKGKVSGAFRITGALSLSETTTFHLLRDTFSMLRTPSRHAEIVKRANRYLKKGREAIKKIRVW